MTNWTIKFIANIVVMCTISLSACSYQTPVVCIAAIPEKKDMAELYKNLSMQPSFKKLLDVSSIDTNHNRIVLILYVYDDMVMESCEKLLYFLMQDRNYGRIDYCIGY